MITIQQGFGILALIIPAAFGSLSVELMGKEYFFWGFGGGALTVWFLGRWLNRRSWRVLMYLKSGEQVALKNHHTFFCLPMQYWTFVWLGLLTLGYLCS